MVRLHHGHYRWVDELRSALGRAEGGDVRVYVVGEVAATEGALGLVTCLRQEAGGGAVRLYMLTDSDTSTHFDLDAPEIAERVRLDLVVNERRGGVWGSHRHLLLPDGEPSLRVDRAYVNTLTRGDLASLRWIESPPRAAIAPGEPCAVYCAPLNFRDVMLATGKLPPDALPGDLAGQDCILGLEFSGRDERGRRVMGMVPARGLATVVQADPGFLWEVPAAWTLEQAATVPVAYATVSDQTYRASGAPMAVPLTTPLSRRPTTRSRCAVACDAASQCSFTPVRAA